MATIFYKTTTDKEQIKRVEASLIKEYGKNLVSIFVDFPSKNCENTFTKNIIQCMESIFEGIFTTKIFLKINWIAGVGPVLIMLIDSNANDIKKTCVEIEEKHIFGGCVVINVYNYNGKEITREELNYAPKKCFICGDSLENCKKVNKHSDNEIIQRIQLQYNEYLSNYEDRL